MTEQLETLFAEYRLLFSIPNAPLGEYKDKLVKQVLIKTIEEKKISIHHSMEIFSAAMTHLKWEQEKIETIKLWFKQHLEELEKWKQEAENAL